MRSILVHSEEQCSLDFSILSFWLNSRSNPKSSIFPLPRSRWLASYEGYRSSPVSLVILYKLGQKSHNLLCQQYDIIVLLVHLGAIFWLIHGLKYKDIYFAASCTFKCDSRNRRASIPFVRSKLSTTGKWKY